MSTTLRLTIAAVLGWAIVNLSTVTAQAQFDYVTNNGTITITRYKGGGGAVVIPREINGLPVTSIGDSAFHDCHSLTKVTVPGSVTTIGSWAFRQCTSLTGVTLSEGLTRIGFGAFMECPKLVSVTIPETVTEIEGAPFSACEGLNVIAVSTLNAHYTSVDGVLFDKSRTTLIECPGGATGSYMIPETVTRIGSWAFNGCRRLTSITIPESVANIEAGAFISCYGLASVTIPNGVTNIGFQAFLFCGYLTNVSISSSVNKIEDQAFWGCDRLAGINVDPLNTSYSSVDGVLIDNSQARLIQCPEAKAGTFTIPTTVTSIERGAFAGCLRLTNVTIPEGVTNIGWEAFSGCSLTSVTIPNSVTSIDLRAFSYCNSLTSVTIGTGVTSLNGGRFFDPLGIFTFCSSLTSVTIPNSVTSIGDTTYYGCTSLTNIIIPNSVTNIGSWAFGGCTNLTEVCFQGDAPTFGTEVFEGTTNAPVYYLPGTTDWGTTFGGRATAVWVRPNPVILKSTVGIQTNAFGFRISWATNVPVVVEASTSLSNPTWSALSTNTLTDGWSDFIDPAWANYPGRFYRVRAQ